MMKKTLFIFTMLLSFICISNAYADFEAVETTLGKVEKLQREGQNVQEKLKQVQAEINAERQGASGALGKVETAIPNVKKVDVSHLPDVAGAVEGKDKQQLGKAVEENFVPDYSDPDKSKVFEETKAKEEANKRNNAVRMYAYAFTLRTNMEKTRKEEKNKDEEINADDGRSPLRAANEVAAESARRMAHIWDMQASLTELNLSILIQELASVDMAKTDDTEGEAE
jgi:hypothetical protein